MSYPEVAQDSAENGCKLAVTTLGARIAAIVSLIVALAVFQTNDLNLDGRSIYTYKDFRSYKYGFWVAIIGVAYSVLQVPFAMHYMMRKKHLINTYAFLKFDFYADKMAAFVVATAAGAVFGATMDLKHQVKWSYDNDEVQSFLTVAYIPAAFLLLGTIACWISSIHSSRALSNKLTNLQF